MRKWWDDNYPLLGYIALIILSILFWSDVDPAVRDLFRGWSW